jgi:hypothetical protein
LENVSSAVPVFDILSQMSAGSRVRLTGVDWTTDTSDFLQHLLKMRGMTEEGINTEIAVVSGKWRIKNALLSTYVEAQKLKEYGVGDKCNVRHAQTRETRLYQRRGYVEEADSVLDWEDDEGFDCAPMARPMPSMAAPAAKSSFAMEDLSSLLDRTDDSFANTLLHLIDRSGEKDSAIYKRANVSRQTFSKIRNEPNYVTTKSTALAFAVALRLNLEETKMLLNRAGLAMTHADKRDIVVEYFIVNGLYDIFEINNALFSFDLPLLGSNIK